jgi:hypothetical protein
MSSGKKKEPKAVEALIAKAEKNIEKRKPRIPLATLFNRFQRRPRD